VTALQEQIKIIETKLLEKSSTSNGINAKFFNGNAQEWNYKDYDESSDGRIPDTIPKTAKKLLLEVYASAINIMLYTEKSFVYVRPTENNGSNYGGYIVELELDKSFKFSIRRGRYSFGNGISVWIIGYK
jgi:hypothetical protein